MQKMWIHYKKAINLEPVLANDGFSSLTVLSKYKEYIM